MAQKAQVESMEALADFRNTLLAFKSEIDGIVDEVLMDVTRTRQWLETDQRDKWESISRRLERDLADARQELLSARISRFRSDIEPRKTVDKIKHAIEDSHAKLTRIKWWTGQFVRQAELLVKPLGNLRDTVSTQVPKAVALISETVHTLNEYAELATVNRETPTPTPSAGNHPHQSTERPS